MSRYKKLHIKKGPKRLKTISGQLELRQTFFCPECGKRLKSSRTQKPERKNGYLCDKVKLHRSGLEYFWPLDFVRIHHPIEST